MIPLRILLVDDERLAVRRLEQLLGGIDSCAIVGQAGGVAEARELIAADRPDVVLLDIRMRDGEGFEVLDGLEDAQLPEIVFVTAFDEFALQAFEANAADYVLKPVSAKRLSEAIERVRRRVAARRSPQEISALRTTIEDLKHKLLQSSGSQSQAQFWIKGRSGLVRVAVDEVQWVSVEGDYLRLHTARGSFLLRDSLRSFLLSVPSEDFVRVHRNALARVSEIESFGKRAGGGSEVILRNGMQISVGRIHAKKLRESLLLRRRHQL